MSRSVGIGRGTFLGSFGPEDKILTITQSGNYRLTGIDVSTHFDQDMVLIEKFNSQKAVSAIYLDGESKTYFVKRFMIDNPNKEEVFITEHPKSQLEIVLTDYRPMAEVILSGKGKENMIINLEEFIAVKGIKAIGNQLTTDKIKQVNVLESLPYEAPHVEEVDVIDEEIINEESNEEIIIPTSNTDDIIADEEGQTLLF